MLHSFNLKPSPFLQPFINNIWVVEDRGLLASKREKMIPFGCMDLVFIEKGGLVFESKQGIRKKVPPAFITGQITQPYFMEYLPGTRMLGFGFYPHTGHVFTRTSSREFTDELIDLEEVIGRVELEKMMESLFQKQGFQAKVRQVERRVFEFLGKNLISHPSKPYAEAVLKKILGARGMWTLDESRAELGISKRHIQSIFKDEVGVRPVLFAKIVRFLHAITLLQKLDSPLVEKAYQLGYFDQSHFIKDFKRFSGLSPRNYLKEQHGLLDDFTSNDSSSFLYNSWS